MEDLEVGYLSHQYWIAEQNNDLRRLLFPGLRKLAHL